MKGRENGIRGGDKPSVSGDDATAFTERNYQPSGTLMPENYLSTGAVAVFQPRGVITQKTNEKKMSETRKKAIGRAMLVFSPFCFLLRRSEIPPRGERPTKPELAH